MSVEQRLWAAPDGAVCMLKVRNSAPHFEVLVVRAGTVLARRRFYAEASAYMLGESWRPTSAARSAIADDSAVVATERRLDSPGYLADWNASHAEAIDTDRPERTPAGQPF